MGSRPVNVGFEVQLVGCTSGSGLLLCVSERVLVLLALSAPLIVLA
jgi:hypothetical protein